VSIEVSENQGIRYLHFGSKLVQGAMRVARPWALELEYTRELMFPLLLRPESWPRAVLQVGLGAASTAKFLFRHRPRARITVVELDADVLAAARAFFRMPDDPRLRIEIGEGHEFTSSTRSQFDLVVVDGFDAEGRPGMLDQSPFYLACRQRLRERGLVAINLIDRGRNLGPGLDRLREAFDGQVHVLPRNPGGNTIVIAGEAVLPTPEALLAAAQKLKAATGLDLAPTVARMS
jgi:spermidine synthase